KLFVTASAEVRAQRRYAELAAKGEASSFEKVLADVLERDARDRDRAEAPLVAATDAVTIDTSDLDIDTAVQVAIEAVTDRLA
ncbi:MAG: (d)CMP kinase, partial [Pseudomonadota bacterium]